ncbi:hypothetical protein D9M72_557730 [compost metagenome]
MFVLAERIGGGEHEGRPEKIPLRLEPGIRRHVEHFPDDGIPGADEYSNQDEPGHRFADELGNRVYESAEAE